METQVMMDVIEIKPNVPEEKPYLCNKCGVMLTPTVQLCTACGGSSHKFDESLQDSDVKMPLTPTDEKPHICDKCGVVLTPTETIDALLCTTCGGKSSTRQLTTPTEGKPYLCDMCGVVITPNNSTNGHLCCTCSMLTKTEVGLRSNDVSISYAKTDDVITNYQDMDYIMPLYLVVPPHGFSQKHNMDHHGYNGRDQFGMKGLNTGYSGWNYPVVNHVLQNVTGNCHENGNSGKVLSRTENWFECEECGKEYKTNKGLQQHVEIHTGGKEFQCTICGKSFLKKFTLDNHMAMLHNKKPYQCTKCGETFQRKYLLIEHGDEKHNIVNSLKCKQFGVTFKTVNMVKQHMRTAHTEDKRFKCTLCGKAFSKSYNLNLHLATHTDERPYQCAKCEQSFKTPNNLYQHQAVHNKKQLCKCDQCGGVFSRKAGLKRHILTVHNKAAQNSPHQRKVCA